MYIYICSEVEQGREGVGGRMGHREVWSTDLTEKVDLSSIVKEGRGGKLQELQ